MAYPRRAILAFTLLSTALLSSAAFAQPKRAITVEDCVSVRYLNPDDLTGAIRMNAQGTLVAYVIKAPNISENRNDDELYVKDISGSNPGHPRMLVSASAIANIQWLKDGKHFVALVSLGGEASISEFDAETGTQTEWIHSKDDVREYSFDANADVLVYAAEVASKDLASLMVTPEERARGYRIPPYASSTSLVPHREIYISRRLPGDAWSAPTLLPVRLPITHESVNQIPYLIKLALSISPDGKRLLFNYDESSELPESWKQNPTIRLLTERGLPGILVTALDDLASGSTTIPLPSAQPTQVPVWSDDSNSYIALSNAPVGSSWAHEDEVSGRILTDAGYHLFWVRPSDGKIEMIPVKATDTRDPVLLFWNNAGRTVGIRTDPTSIELYTRTDDGWRPGSSIHLPIKHYPHNMQLASDGKMVVGDIQATTKPPELFLFDVARNALSNFEFLNPQFASLEIAPVREVHWKTSTGFPETGLLFLPTDYDATRRYPLVIGTKFTRGEFACDSGSFHSPSFAPQPTANAGMMYLVGFTPEGTDGRSQEAFYPKGYPGGTAGVAEAAFYMDVWDSAVDALNSQGLIDTSKLGVIGFSRTGWHTEFMLTHSRHHYAAAAVADNVQYNLSEYWLQSSHAARRGFETMYSGPPYGPSLDNWKKYSISFNLDKVHTPLLMEENGYGVTPDRLSIPWSIATTAEVFTGLTELQKPVEMYFYPDEQHQPDHPKARVANLQRNLDWFRFWLQGFERKDHPEDLDMYKRWRQFRQMQDTDENTSSMKTVD